jgi:SAM-dependent methyltransferase
MVSRAQPLAGAETDLRATNARFYDGIWADVHLVEPQRFNTWPLVRTLSAHARDRLEVAPGLRPRLPLEGTCFAEISPPAAARLRARGANVFRASISSLPFSSGAFDLVCALDVVEHVDDDDRALSELARVAEPGGALLLSMPLHPSHWSAFDEFVGHRRRYDPELLRAKLARHGLCLESSAAYGMRPRSSRLLDLGIWWLTHHRERALWWYNHVMMPLALRFEKKLAFAPGMIDTREVDELLLLCRKVGTAQA